MVMAFQAQDCFTSISQVDVVTTKGQYKEKDAAAAVRTMLEVGEAPNMLKV